MWLDNLKELKKSAGMSAKQIADLTKLPERTVVRIFSGDTPNPYVDTLYRIVVILGGSLDDVLADSKTVVGSKNLVTLQSEVDRLIAENEALTVQNEMLTAENAVLKDKVSNLTTDNNVLRTNLEHKEEIISLHNHYRTILGGLAKGQIKNQRREKDASNEK